MSRPTGFVFVSAEMRAAFLTEWRSIDERLPLPSDAPDGMTLAEHMENLMLLRASARDELRRALRQAAALGHHGIYPVAV